MRLQLHIAFSVGTYFTPFSWEGWDSAHYSHDSGARPYPFPQREAGLFLAPPTSVCLFVYERFALHAHGGVNAGRMVAVAISCGEVI